MLLPLNGLINRSVEGNLLAHLSWRNATRESEDRLNNAFPVICLIHNPELKSHGSISFTRSISYRDLPSGLIEIVCNCPTLHVRANPVQKLIVGQYKDRVVRPVTNEFLALETLSNEFNASIGATSETVRSLDHCKRPKLEVSWERFTLRIHVEKWDQTMSEYEICPDEEPGRTFEFHAKELYLGVKPEQSFYLFNQNPSVTLFLTKNHSTPYEQSLLDRIDGNWKVLNAKGRVIPFVIDKDSSLSIYNFVSFAVPSKELVPGEFFYEYNPLKGFATFNRKLTIVSSESITLMVNGLNKKFHVSGGTHIYTCLLEGVNLIAISQERYKPRWKSLIPDKQVVQNKNAIRVTPDSELGLYDYRCYYKKNGLNLFEDVVFSIVKRESIRLSLTFSGSPSLVHDVSKGPLFVRCESSHLRTTSVNGPLWRSLDGKSKFVSYDHSDYISSKTDMFVLSMSSGLSTFQCTEVIENTCTSRLVIFLRTKVSINLTLEPNKPYFKPNETVTCVSKSELPASLSRPLLSLLDAPAFLQFDIVDSFTFPSYFPGGRHRYECTLFLPEDEPIVYAKYFDFFAFKDGDTRTFLEDSDTPVNRQKSSRRFWTAQLAVTINPLSHVKALRYLLDEVPPSTA
ncbi:unnamed protein product [Echinostoma caproni]|uniref:Ig-like domain-containing protein n=1 Tax=Echinostoma caproni TaxID=27848 RepID=A0A183ATJ9_9TREM|nr:unnamed protein product [Echinostoma caproni]